MSGSQVAYHLRVNKFVDRQLFVEALDRVGRFRKLSDYGYISMAGAYLEDCRVLHEAHRISRMHTFDTESTTVERQKINRPYGFIHCEAMSSGEMVDNLDGIRSGFGQQETPVIVWLDYTAPRLRKEQLQEVQRLMPRLLQGDVLRVTLNAERKTLAENTAYQALGNGPPTLADYRLEKLRAQLGDYLPPDRDDADFLASPEGFVQTLIGSIKLAIIRGLQSRSELRAFPLLSTSYNDGHHSMMTTMIFLLREDERRAFEDRSNWADWPHNPGTDWDNFVEIRVPHLSLRERHLLHETLVSGGEFNSNSHPFISNDELRQYMNHYLRYPTFAPLALL